ncbi:hypothetical protein DPMN_032029 [Dreissena polymorpha]|uniref:Uncharacterized protein n=1 Tax=Dreissena polymorpha TaxID=45954 RepID=A0A9D4RJV8_DREPO|nr:hypothetical protein DPMN_032029 [Dreissena polymorpha]
MSLVFPVTSLTLKMTSKLQLLTLATRPYDALKRVLVSATNVPNFATIFKGVCERHPFNAYVYTSIVTSSAGIPFNRSGSASSKRYFGDTFTGSEGTETPY